MQPTTGIRETFKVDAEYQITQKDYINGKVFDNAVSYLFFPRFLNYCVRNINCYSFIAFKNNRMKTYTFLY